MSLIQSLAELGASVEGPGRVRHKPLASFVVDKHGRVVDVLSRAEVNDKGKLVLVSERMFAPLKSRSSDIVPSFIDDIVEYAAGWSVGGSEGAVKERKKLDAYKAFTIKLLPPGHCLRLYAESGEADAFHARTHPLVSDLDEIAEYITSNGGDFSKMKYWVEFLYDDYQPIRDDPAVIDAVAQYRRGLWVPGESPCTVSGAAEFRPVKTVPKIQLGGDEFTLTSNNIDSQSFYGREQGDNAPISPEQAENIIKGYSKLIEQQGVKTVNGVSVMMWSADDKDNETNLHDEISSLLRIYVDPDKVENARQLNALPKDARLCVAQVVGQSKRVRVISFFDGPFADFENKALTFQTDMQMIGEDKAPYLWEINAVLNNHSWPRLTSDLLDCIIQDTPIPARVFSALVSIISNAGKSPHVIRTDPKVRSKLPMKNAVRYLALQNILLQGIMRRNHRLGVPGFEKGSPMDASNSDDKPDVGFLLGQLFRLYEYTQDTALQNVNAGIGIKFFRAAMTTPLHVFSFLSDKQNVWLNTMRKDESKKGSAVRISKEMSRIMEALGDRVPIPVNMSLDDRARFVIGYHAEDRFLFTKKDETNAQNSQ